VLRSLKEFMIVGFEWIIDAAGCNPDDLRDVDKLRAVFAAVVSDLQLKTIGDGAWHKFGGEGGVTGLVMLTESHLACHTYPEHNSATFNLYCCRSRPEWSWGEKLREMIGAKQVTIKIIERGKIAASSNPKSKIQNPKSLSVGGDA
jgi:S-adenosylmethionine decarboxylase